MTAQRHGRQGLDAVLQDATDLHGHFGPFLALGVRIGLVGLRELRVKQGDTRLHTTVMLEYVAPISCVLDGIQVSTKCTVGNTRLTWKESSEISVTFQLSSSRRKVEIRVNPAIIRELQRKLAKPLPDEEIRQIGLDIASLPDAELFLCKR